MSQLPIASRAQTTRHAKRLVREHLQSLLAMIGLYGLAAISALIPAAQIGAITDAATHHVLTDTFVIQHVGLIALSGIVNTGFSFAARRYSYRLGESVFAQLREEFLASVLSLPLTVLERAGTGDLLSRSTNDIEALSRTVRFAVPEWIVAIVQTTLALGAMVIISPVASLGAFVSIPFLVFSTRWYLRYATPGYLRERVSYASMSGSVAETTEGLRTIDALRLGPIQYQRIMGDIRESFFSEIYTLFMRMVWFPITESAFSLATAITMAWAGWLAIRHHISVGAATTLVMYVVQLNDPLDRIVAWLDELQIGQTALARIIGVSTTRDEPPIDPLTPGDGNIVLSDVNFSYRTGFNVLHDVSLSIKSGERLAIVGPSGAGKSTLGRILAGIETPDSGDVTIGGVAVSSIPQFELRRNVALVTQEHHVFIGTVRDNLTLAKPEASDEQLRSALATVGALGWVDELPLGLHTELGASGHQVNPSQAQQIALARLMLANPHTLVLDEATALIDSRTARQLELSLSAVMAGKTVIAIAHRLHTAHDADRVCVIVDGRIAELGSHNELLQLNGEYASLWRSWQNDGFLGTAS